MRSGTPSFALVVLAALLSSSATLGFAQVTPGASAEATTATTAPTGATHDCSGMTGAPLANCRRLNAAEPEAPTTPTGPSEDCSGQIGDALVACRALNGQPPEPDAAATGAGTTGVAPQH